jgi:hypothetical protein
MLKGMGRLTTKEEILEAVAERDVDHLWACIARYDLQDDIREFLADVIRDLLTGKRKFPKGRPPTRSLIGGHEQSEIAPLVWQAVQRGAKVEFAVEEVARDLDISERSVWGCWSSFDPIEHEMSFREIVMDGAFHMWRADNPDKEVSSIRAAASSSLQRLCASFPGTERDYDVLIPKILEELSDIDSSLDDGGQLPKFSDPKLAAVGFRGVVMSAILEWLKENPTGRELTFLEMAREKLVPKLQKSTD